MDGRSETRRTATGLAGEGAGSGLVGRERELAALRNAIDGDKWVAVVGEAGIGKTALLQAAAASAHRRVHGFAGLATLSERPFAALRRLLGHVDGDAAYVASTLERLVGPDVLLVDDVQWLDLASRDAVAMLVGRVAILAAVRSGTATSEAALQFADSVGFERLELGPLTREAGIALARAVDPSLTVGQAERLAARAGGNAFFTVELATVGASSTGTDVVIRRRLADLDEAALRSARRLAVLGRPATAAEIDPGASSLIRSGIAVTDAEAIAFQHQLFAEHLLAALDAADLATARLEAARATSDPLEAATLYLAAGHPAQAVAAAAVAEREALTTGDRIDALVIRAAAASGEEAARIKVAAAAELMGIHNYVRASKLLEGIEPWNRAAAVRIATMRDRIQAVVGNVAGLGERFAVTIADARALVEAGDPEGPGVLVEALRTGAQVRGWTGDPEGGLQLAEEAVEVALANGAPSAAVQTLLGYLLLTADRGFEAIGPLREAVAARAASGDGPNELQALNVLLLAEMSITGHADALGTCRRLIARAGELHLEAGREGYKPYLTFLLDAAGQYREAVAVAEDTAGVLEARGAIYGPAYAALALAHTGRFEAARALLAKLEGRRTEDPEAERVYLDMGAMIDLAQGRAAQAERTFEAFAAMPQKSESDRMEPLLNARWARLDLGRPPGPPIDPGPTPRVVAVGPDSRGLALLHAGDYAGAAAAFDEAAAAWGPFLTWNEDRSRWAAAEALRRAGEHRHAVERLLACERVAEAREARPQLVRVQRSLRQLGVRRTAPRAPSGSDLLSGRERELLNLVAAGHNNAEIARRLGLGRPTIARVLSSAMGKLGVEHRTQLAARELV